MTDLDETDLSGLRVLIVDDEEVVRALLETMLRRMGIKYVTCVASAHEALESLETTPVDVAIVDWQLEDMDGGTLITAMRRRTGEKPETFGIFMLTGFPVADRVIAANAAGANEFLVKPIRSDTLARHFADFVRQRAAHVKRQEARISNWNSDRP